MRTVVKRKHLLVLAVSTALAVSPALAETRDNAAVVSVTNQLEDYGYVDIDVVQTFLGRIKITAHRGEVTRELVMTRSGKILRDELFDSGDLTEGEFGAHISERAQSEGRSFGSSVAGEASGGASGAASNGASGAASGGASGGGRP
jgi:hypothetical protein